MEIPAAALRAGPPAAGSAAVGNDPGRTPAAAPTPAPIRVVVGLGNPGARYQGTRHNIGFEALTALLEGRASRRRHFDGGELVEAEIAGRPVAFLRPTTYMNRSGGPVRRCLASASVPPGAALVVCDDTALPLGAIRTRRRGSDGGHNGLASIFGALGTTEVPRMRLGVGAPPPGEDPADHVLAPFAAGEEEQVEDLLVRAAAAIGAALEEGLDAAMNRFNRTPA